MQTIGRYNQKTHCISFTKDVLFLHCLYLFMSSSMRMSADSRNAGSVSGERTRDKAFKSPPKLKMKTLGPVVRDRIARKDLKGFSCKSCEDYYRTKNLSEEELKSCLNACSRHRCQHSPPKSPEHFWETDFPSTPECIQRGTFNVDDNPTPRPKRRRRHRRLSKDFLKVVDKKLNVSPID